MTTSSNGSPPGDTWLVIAGAVSAYTFELYRRVQAASGIRVRFLHDPPRNLGSAFVHDSFVVDDFESLSWMGASARAIQRFIVQPPPAAVFVYGTAAKVPIAIASLALPGSVPMIYVADDNIAELAGRIDRSTVRRAAYRVLLRRVDAALSLGLTNRLAMEALGMPRVLDAPFYPVDYAQLESSDAGPAAARPSPDDDGSRRLRALVVARLVPEKNIVAVVAALARDEELVQRLHLVFVGEGPERPALERLVADNPQLSAEVLGPVPRNRVGPLFQQADLLLLPSGIEPWGIVVTEALGMGIPVVCTPAVGAGVSLAGLTQAVVVADDVSPDAVRVALHRFVARHQPLRDSARATAPVVRARYGVDTMAERLVEVVGALKEGLRAAVRPLGPHRANSSRASAPRPDRMGLRAVDRWYRS